MKDKRELPVIDGDLGEEYLAWWEEACNEIRTHTSLEFSWDIPDGLDDTAGSLESLQDTSREVECNRIIRKSDTWDLEQTEESEIDKELNWLAENPFG